jgi:hypothetical protein
MEAVLRLLAWRESAVVNIPVPEYIVNDSTKALKNLDFWLSEVDEARANWLARVNARDLKQSLMRQEATLLRLIRGPQPVVAYSNRIAQWALDASEAPSNIREYWTQIFNTRKQSEIIALHSASVDELLEHLLDNLDTASVYAQVAIAHVRKIKQVNAAGPAVMFLDMDDLDVRPLSAGEILAMQATEGEEHFYDDEVIDPTLTAADRRILAIRASHMPRKERATTDEIIRSAPTEKPVKENYSSHLEYLKARAAYEVAQTALKQREQYDAQKAKDAEQVARLLSNISDKQSGAHEAGNGDSHAE